MVGWVGGSKSVNDSVMMPLPTSYCCRSGTTTTRALVASPTFIGVVTSHYIPWAVILN